MLHVDGAHGDRMAALKRFAAGFEPDEDSFALPDLLRLHQITGVPVVLDSLQYQSSTTCVSSRWLHRLKLLFKPIAYVGWSRHRPRG